MLRYQQFNIGRYQSNEIASFIATVLNYAKNLEIQNENLTVEKTNQQIRHVSIYQV